MILHGWFKQSEYIASFLISTISCTCLKSCLIVVFNQIFCHYIFLSSRCIAAYFFHGIGAKLVSNWSYLPLLEKAKDYWILSYHQQDVNLCKYIILVFLLIQQFFNISFFNISRTVTLKAHWPTTFWKNSIRSSRCT